MKIYQSINIFPGLEEICNKKRLNVHLSMMKKQFPQQYKFFPQTWSLPADFNQFKQDYNTQSTYILKPDNNCQGKGIFLFRKKPVENLINIKGYVVQKYIDSPLLLDDLKFDFRIYILVANAQPLQIYMYNEGMARFATEKYEKPNIYNSRDTYLHLTNYSINKNNPKFEFNENEEENSVGHKRSMTSVFNTLQKLGINVDEIQKRIKQNILKTIVSIHPYLSRNQKVFYNNPYSINKFYHVLGFDILLDNKLKPWVLEVNAGPSFATDSPFDLKIKYSLINDTIKLLKLNDVERNQQLRKLHKPYSDKKMVENLSFLQNENPVLGNYINLMDENMNSYIQQFIQYTSQQFDQKFFGKNQKQRNNIDFNLPVNENNPLETKSLVYNNKIKFYQNYLLEKKTQIFDNSKQQYKKISISENKNKIQQQLTKNENQIIQKISPLKIVQNLNTQNQDEVYIQQNMQTINKELNKSFNSSIQSSQYQKNQSDECIPPYKLVKSNIKNYNNNDQNNNQKLSLVQKHFQKIMGVKVPNNPQIFQFRKQKILNYLQSENLIENQLQVILQSSRVGVGVQKEQNDNTEIDTLKNYKTFRERKYFKQFMFPSIQVQHKKI